MITGTYDYFYDWGNTGNYASSTIIFNNDNTFITDSYTGKWSALDGSLAFIYDTNGTVYSGSVCGHAMVGSMTLANASSSGAWYAVSRTGNTLAEKQIALSAAGNKI